MERDADNWEYGSAMQNFNSHAHVERDYITVLLCMVHSHFNSHAHVERDYTTGAGTAIVFNFNSHAHVERDAPESDMKMVLLSFQLTRSRGA